MTTAAESAFLRVLRGEAAHPAPMWLMRQAGRYLPEYRATRARAGGFLDLCFTPELAAEVTLQPIERFGFDAAILFSDILVIPWALGQKVEFVEGVGPVLEPIANAADFERLRPEQLLERLAPVFEAIRLIKASLPAGTPLIGFAGAPWTLATYMIAGRGTPDQAPAKEMAAKAPELFGRIIALLEECCARFMAAQADAGVDALKIFDSWAGGAPADRLDDIVIDPVARILSRLKSAAPTTPVIAFPRMLGDALPRFAQKASPDGIALDQSVDPSWAVKALTNVPALQGNFEPTLLTQETPDLETPLRRLREAFDGRPHIFNLGHGITPDAKIENVERMIEIWRGFDA